MSVRFLSRPRRRYLRARECLRFIMTETPFRWLIGKFLVNTRDRRLCGDQKLQASELAGAHLAADCTSAGDCTSAKETMRVGRT